MIIWIAALVVGLFAIGALMGAPYLPTRRRQSEAALQLLNLKRGQTVIDLGSGDGRFLLAVAQQGIKGVGYEINPLLVIWSKLLTWRYRHLVNIKWANFWSEKLPAADGIYVFLITRYMKKLDQKLANELKPGTKVASYTFKIPGRRMLKSNSGVYLYQY